LLKQNSQDFSRHRWQKFGSIKSDQVSALSSGLNRRAFLRNSSATFLVASLAACKSNINLDEIKSIKNEVKASTHPTNDIFKFTKEEKKNLLQVQEHLFPKDGDGPSASDVNSFTYLEWALTDPDNASDGDGDFIKKGVGWLDGLAKQTQGDSFFKLSFEQQDKVLRQISKSSTGENWMSIIIYYIMEALLFDPIYGGNPDGIGWKWLQHQPGFPVPDSDTLYRSFI